MNPVEQVFAFQNGSSSTVVAVTADGLVFSLEAWPAAGRRPRAENWFQRIPNARIESPAAVDGDRLYFGASDGFLYALDLVSGSIAWKTPLAGTAGSEAPLISNGAVFIASSAGLEVFSTVHGAAAWTSASSQRLITRIDDRCYTDEGDGVCCVRRASDGECIGTFSLESFQHVPAVPGGGVFIAGTGEGHLIAYR